MSRDDVVLSVALEKPKYDPCRLFKKGDKVRVVEYKGRSYSLYWKKRLGEILTVTESEDETADIEVDEQCIDPAYLELVTPVEELEPYYVRESGSSFSIAREGEKGILSVYFKGFHPHARAAAKADRDRLNEEWRKEQNNG